MIYNVFIGIDPGQDGGIAVIDPAGVQVRTLPFIKNELDGLELHGWMETLTLNYPEKPCPIAYIERVGAMPGQGVTSMWNFGYVTGQLHMWLKMLHIPFKVPTPQAWKKIVLAGTDRGKEAAINYCLRAYPDVSLRATPKSTKHHDGLADALCLADFAMREERVT